MRSCLTRTSLPILLAAGAVGFGASAAFGQALDVSECRKAYVDTLAKYTQNDVLLSSLRSIYSHVCLDEAKASSTSLDASLQAVIGGVPVVGSWAAKHNVKNDLAFCKEYKSDESLYFSDNTRNSEPVGYAQRNFNECVEIFNRGKVIVTHEVAPGSINISFRRTDAMIKFVIQGVDRGSYTCTAYVADGKTKPRLVGDKFELELAANATLQCKRGPIGTGENKYYPYDRVHVGTSQGMSYLVEVNEETIYGPSKASEVKRKIAALEAKAARSNALESEIKTAAVSVHPFFVTSGPRGLDGATGPKWAWGEVIGKPKETWEELAKKRFCPKANRVLGYQLRVQGGNCCGNYQFLAVCNFANPNVDR